MDNPIRIARISANDDTVMLQAWHVADGHLVKPGDLLMTLETSKATIDVEAESEGYLKVLIPAGKYVAVGETVALITASKGTSVAQASPTLHSNGHSTAATPSTRVSKLAQAMMAHHGISPEELPQAGLIRKQDIEAFLQSKGSQGPSSEPAPEIEASPLPSDSRPADSSSVTHTASPGKSVGFFADARKSAGDRGKGIIWLAFNYFFRNYCLGHIARWSPLGVNLLVHKLRGVKMGKGVYIDPSATIETAYPENVTIGNDVRITANAIIMTHIKAPHALRNQGIVPHVLQPVVLEDHCFIGVNAVIMPGVTIGRGSVVTSGSVVLTNVPPAVMVTGNPAKVVKRLNPVKDESKN